MAEADAINSGVGLSMTSAMDGCAKMNFTIGAFAEELSGILEASFEGTHGRCDVARLPWGPAAVIGPWNAPIAGPSFKIATALVVGCPVILKPSE